MENKVAIRRALLSVSDKTGIIEFAKQLHSLNVELLSTGGTAKLLQQHQIPVVDVSQYTGFPEILAGRVKTLHPKIYGGLLARRGIDEAVLEQHQIPTIDLVVVNLYPFEKTIAAAPDDVDAAIENIDIGGPTMLRAAAKNFAAVTLVVDQNDFSRVINEMQKNNNATSLELRFELAQKAFSHVAHYDAVIANYFNAMSTVGKQFDFPQTYTVQYQKKQDLRYGENPHQKAAFYAEINSVATGIANAQQLQGKELSFNNIADANAALECVQSFVEPACVIVKHANPCGVAVANDLITAYQKAFATDSVSAFGGIIAFNRPLTAALAKMILDQQFVEVIIAPEIATDALSILEKKPAVRVLSSGNVPESDGLHYQRVGGGLLIQEYDHGTVARADLKIVTQRKPTTAQMDDLMFAWQVVKYVKSNAIVFVKDKATIGIGAGQMSRVDSVEIAIRKAERAGLAIDGAVMASDAFFPFRDGIEAAVTAGISAIIQPGGSIRDAEVIQAADEANVAMVLTGMRHFRH